MKFFRAILVEERLLKKKVLCGTNISFQSLAPFFLTKSSMIEFQQRWFSNDESKLGMRDSPVLRVSIMRVVIVCIHMSSILVGSDHEAFYLIFGGIQLVKSTEAITPCLMVVRGLYI